MKKGYLLGILLVILVLFLIGCRREQPEPGVKIQIVEEPKCTSSEECPSDYSCYYELPAGPSAGIKGSKDNPGKCYSNEMISQIY